jgi:PKHD-type hydroxylase
LHVIAGVLSPARCDALVAAASAATLRPGALVGGRADAQVRRAGLVWLDDLPGQGDVMDSLIAAVVTANRAAFGFDLTDFHESAQVARYQATDQGHFDWHADVGQGTHAARRKLTVVLQLSPPTYAGGVLEVRPSTAILQAPRDQGTMAVFPSVLLHRVTPVTAGERFSLTLWAHGPAFR